VFLAVVPDAYSGRVIGWALDRTLEDELMLNALRVTPAGGRTGSGASLRPALQYVSNTHIGLLKEADTVRGDW
jgi:transposase InsO family protein